MRVSGLLDLEPRERRIAIGQFDGVHLGHRELIRGCDTVVTFEPHPQTVVARKPPPLILSPLPHKARLMRSLGVRELVIIGFDVDRAGQAPLDFIDEVIVAALGATHVSIGANFRFGHRAAGDPAMLAEDGRFDVRVADLVEVSGAPVSSTRIRRLVAQGELVAAAGLLGSWVHLSATVRAPAPGATFDDVGALLSFPPRAAMPPPGAYCCHVGGETATLTVRPGHERQPTVGGWLGGPAVEIRPGATVAIDITGQAAADLHHPVVAPST